MDKAQTYQQERASLALAAIEAVKRKIEDGTYPLEDVPCFCGAFNDRELVTKDRLGIPLRVVVCEECALVRVNPRMTAEAYKQFYNNEYRYLPFPRAWSTLAALESFEEETALVEEMEYSKGRALSKLLDDEDLAPPKVVIDFGCFRGGMLDWFKEQGAKTYGVEFDEEAAKAARAKGHVIVSTLQELVELGVKADLIVMQDVIEHLLDLRLAMAPIKDLLVEDGRLWVFTPGVFRALFHGSIQLAHTYYFVANTLKWVMDQLGFVPTYIDEEIQSFWRYVGPGATDPAPKEWVEYIVDEVDGKLERRMPPFGGICKFTKKLLYGNMKANFSKKVPDLYELTQKYTGPLAIVGGGPSIDGEIEKLHDLQQQGVAIMAIARMYPWCLRHGIIPTYVVSLDCSEEQEKGFETISPDTIHLVASVTRPEIVDKILAGYGKVYLFDSRDEKRIKTLRRDAGYKVATVVNGGGSVTVLCFSLAFNLGYRELHVFGFDCMIPRIDKTHADGIAGQSVKQAVVEATINGEPVITTAQFMEFTRQVLDMLSIAHNEQLLDSVKFYGESLITKMWDCQWHDEGDSNVQS